MKDPGEMKERISLFAPGDIVIKGGIVKKNDGSNSAQIGFLFAKVEYLSGREFYSANQTALEAEIKVTMRYKPQLTEQHFFYWKDKRFDITRITHSDCRMYTTAYAKRVK